MQLTLRTLCLHVSRRCFSSRGYLVIHDSHLRKKVKLLTHGVCYALEVVLDVCSLNVFSLVEWRVAPPVCTIGRN